MVGAMRAMVGATRAMVGATRAMVGATLWLRCVGFSLWWLRCCGAGALGFVDASVVVPGPWSTGSIVVVQGLSCSKACEISPGQG